MATCKPDIIQTTLGRKPRMPSSVNPTTTLQNPDSWNLIRWPCPLLSKQPVSLQLRQKPGNEWLDPHFSQPDCTSATRHCSSPFLMVTFKNLPCLVSKPRVASRAQNHYRSSCLHSLQDMVDLSNTCCTSFGSEFPQQELRGKAQVQNEWGIEFF